MREVTVKSVRNHKDRLFRLLFREKKELLSLYNAMNGTYYKDIEEMTITTLEDAVYIGMKNDVSFVLYDEMMLYEHQSTDNPNIPLRDLFYTAHLYSELIPKKKLYSSKLQKIPEPKFIVFYNGKKQMPERFVYKLSDAYFSAAETEPRIPELELKVLVLNINEGFNEELKEKCRTLREYMIFVGKVRRYLEEMSVNDAVKRVIDECIKEGVLTEFLEKNRAEVLAVSIFEYDEEEHMETVREEGKEEEREAGIKILVETCRELCASQKSTQEKVMIKYGLDALDAERYVRQYWV